MCINLKRSGAGFCPWSNHRSQLCSPVIISIAGLSFWQISISWRKKWFMKSDAAGVESWLAPKKEKKTNLLWLWRKKGSQLYPTRSAQSAERPWQLNMDWTKKEKITMAKTYICECCGKSYTRRYTPDSYIGNNCSYSKKANTIKALQKMIRFERFL